MAKKAMTLQATSTALWECGVTEAGCMAHARRYFVNLVKTDKSTLAVTAVEFIGQLYAIEREVKGMSPKLHDESQGQISTIG